jgi:hypothetical protein
MLPLAHLGIGSLLGRVWPFKLPFRWLLLGTLLPDLIDKPAFFCLGLIEHFRNGGWVPGKRGIAHTALFLFVLIAIAIKKKSAAWQAVSVGTATHLILDVISKMFSEHHTMIGSLTVLLWPFMGWDFPTLSYGLHGVPALMGEIAGAAILAAQLAIRRFRPRSI